MEIDVRIARVDDAEACAAIYAPYVRASVISFEDVPPAADEMRARIAQGGDRFPWLTAVRDGEIVGYAYATAHRTRAAYRWSVDTSVYVARAAHRGGVGRRLYGALFAVLAAQRFQRAFAGITLPNPASVGLHEAVGFIPVGVYQRVGFKAGAWHDVGWWARPLRDDPSPPEPLPLWALAPDVLQAALGAR